MSALSYLDFDLLIDASKDSTFRVRVLNSPVGQETNSFILPFSKLEFHDFALKINHSADTAGSTSHYATSELRKFGAKLFDAVFSGEILSTLRRSIDSVENEEGQILRLRLRLPDSLRDLPWEYLYDNNADRFFALGAKTPIVRYMELSQPNKPLTVTPPLNMLVMVASPSDCNLLDVAKERAKIKAATAKLVEQGLIQLTYLSTANLRALQRQLRCEQYHIFHFIGYRGVDQQTGCDTLIMEDENRPSHRVPVTGNELGEYLHNHESIRLVFLETRKDMHIAQDTLSTDSARQLIRQGIPAVIAMQFGIDEKVTKLFVEGFYDALADCYPVDVALVEGRLSMRNKAWGAPVLYMRTADSRLFDSAASANISVQAQSNHRNSLLIKLKTESRARCMRRWQALGLTRDEAREFADDSAIGSILWEYETTFEQPIVVLTAEMGTGKSLILERLYQRALERSVTQPNAPIPIYVEEASKCDNGKLVDYLNKITNEFKALGDIEKQGMAIFVDEVDNLGPQSVNNLLRDSWKIVNRQQNSTVTLASRPLPVFSRIEGEVILSSMSEEEAKSLVARIANIDTIWLGHWPRSIQDSVRRPLFALLLGTYLRNGQNSQLLSVGELIDDLVRRAFSYREDNDRNAQDLLERLAVLCIERSGTKVLKNEVGTDNEIYAIVASRLVVENSKTVGFALPILTEWFAAQSLAKGIPQPEQLLLNEQTIEKWRYPLVILVANFSHPQVSSMMSPLCARFPGFAAKVIAEGISTWGEPEYDAYLTVEEYGERIRSTMETWVTGIGPLAELIAPANKDGTLRPLCIAQQEQHLTFAWYRGEQELPAIGNFPLDPFRHPSFFSYVGSTRMGRQSAWLWKETHKSLVLALSQLLKKRQLPATSGPMLEELVWSTALAVSGHSSVWSQPVAVAELISRLSNLRENTVYMFKRKEVTTTEIRQLKAKLDELSASDELELAPPWPVPDLNKVPGLIWESYSRERLLERTICVYQAAIQCYKEIVETWFPAFASRLHIASTLPARFVGVIEFQQDGHPIMLWYWEPLSTDAQCSVDIQFGDIPWQSEDKEFHEAAREKLRRLRANSHQWMYTSRHYSKLNDVLQDKPITEIVYNWLWDDLKNISWVTGML